MSSKEAANYYTVSYQNAPQQEVRELIEKLEDLTAGEKRTHQIAALLALAIYRQYPEVSSEVLMRAVQDTSEFICTLFAGTLDGEAKQ